MYRLFMLCALAALGGCASTSNPYSNATSVDVKAANAAAMAVSEQQAQQFKKLPTDADLENLPKQLELLDQGQYLDKSGNRQSLLRPPVASRAPVTQRAATTKPAKAAKRQTRVAEDIDFDPIPEAIDITQGAH